MCHCGRQLGDTSIQHNSPTGPGRGVCNDIVKFWEKSNLVPDISKVISAKDNRTQEGCNAINLPSGERTDRVKQLSSLNLVIAVNETSE